MRVPWSLTVFSTCAWTRSGAICVIDVMCRCTQRPSHRNVANVMHVPHCMTCMHMALPCTFMCDKSSGFSYLVEAETLACGTSTPALVHGRLVHARTYASPR